MKTVDLWIVHNKKFVIETKTISPIIITKTKLTFKLFQDIDNAKKYWEMFSPNLSLFDDWEFRYTAYKYLNLPIYFYVGFLDNKPIWVIPLEWNTEKKYLEFFGWFYMEDNKVLIERWYEDFVWEFYRQVSLPKRLSFISDNSNYEKTFVTENYSYYVNTKEISSFDDYLEKKFSNSWKKHFKRNIRSILDNHKVEIIMDRFEDINIMFEYSLKNFWQKCDLILEPSESQFELDLLKKFDSHLISFVIDWKIQAVSLVLYYNNVLYWINWWINYSDINNLWKLVFKEKIDIAIKNGFSMYHAWVWDYNWKKDWHLDSYVQKMV